MDGWIKLHRCSLENPTICKDSDYFTVWCYLLLNATHKSQDAIFNGERITLQEGQLITGRNSISEKFSINPSKVQRILKKLEIEHQIEQQTGNKNRLISILKWGLYQESEQQSEQQVNNKRTTSEQQVNTNKNERKKECKNDDKKDIECNPPPDTLLELLKPVKPKKAAKEFIPPTLEEVGTYCQDRKSNVDPKQFFDYFDTSGWVDSKGNKVKNWKQKVITWEGLRKNDSSNSGKPVAPAKQNRFVNYTQREWDFEQLEKLQREERDKW